MSFMRQLTIYLILISIFLSNNLRSQTERDLENPVAKKISLVFQDASLRDLISEISNLSGVKFVFDDKLLQVKKPFTLKIKDKTTIEILEQILKDLKIGFVVQSKSQVVLTKKSTIKARYGTIKGRVVNSITGEPLWKANLEILTTNYGAASNKGGFFELRALAGVHHLRMSMIGFIAHERHQVKVSADKATYVTFRLRPTVIEMPAVQVSSKRYLVPEHMQIEPSVLTVRRSQLTDIPSIGEPDLFRVLQALPGISAPNDFSNELFIRGGDSDQNLIMLDGAVVYNPYHMFGLVGSFNPDIIEQVNLSLGGFSARYGDRLSAVVDVRTINDAPEHFGGYANFSLISSKFMAMGNVDSKVNWIVSGRRTYHDAVASLFGKSVPYYFYDLYGKLAVRPNVRNLFYFSGFFSRDLFLQKDNYHSPNVEDSDNPFEAPDLSVEIPDGEGFIFNSREEVIWDNLIISAHWLHEFSEGNHFEIQVSQSENPSDFLFKDTYTAQANASVATREFVERRNRIRQEFDDFQGE